MQVLDVAIENGTTSLWYGRVIGFLGTHARAVNKSELLNELVAEGRYHMRWLQRHGEPSPSIEDPDLNIREEITGIDELGESGGEVALFDFDIVQIEEKLLSTALRYMGYNRLDLLDLCKSVNVERLNEIPTGKGRSIEDILQHVCNAEEFYTSRLGMEADETYERHLGMPVADADELPIMKRLDVVRNACIKTLRDLIPIKGESIFQRQEYTSYPKEEWTAHKVVRRFLEHEREHIYNIREYLKTPIRPSV
ncbi:MAG: DinB family protein [Candidatus Thorarchaeota archaeon]